MDIEREVDHSFDKMSEVENVCSGSRGILYLSSACD